MRRLFAIMTTIAFLLAGCKKEDSNVVQSIQFTNVENGRLTMLIGENFRVKYTVEPASRLSVIPGCFLMSARLSDCLCSIGCADPT